MSISRADKTPTVYRETILGESLHRALFEMVNDKTLSKDVGRRVMEEFDTVVNRELNDVHTSATMKGDLHTYRHVDQTWQFTVENATFKLPGNVSIDEKDAVTAEPLQVQIVAQSGPS